MPDSVPEAKESSQPIWLRPALTMVISASRCWTRSGSRRPRADGWRSRRSKAGHAAPCQLSKLSKKLGAGDRLFPYMAMVLVVPPRREDRLGEAPTHHARSVKPQSPDELVNPPAQDHRWLGFLKELVAQECAYLVLGPTDHALGVDGEPRFALGGEDVFVVQVAVEEHRRARGSDKLREKRLGPLHQRGRQRARPAVEPASQCVQPCRPLRDCRERMAVRRGPSQPFDNPRRDGGRLRIVRQVRQTRARL